MLLESGPRSEAEVVSDIKESTEPEEFVKTEELAEVEEVEEAGAGCALYGRLKFRGREDAARSGIDEVYRLSGLPACNGGPLVWPLGRDGGALAWPFDRKGGALVWLFGRNGGALAWRCDR